MLTTNETTHATPEEFAACIEKLTEEELSRIVDSAKIRSFGLRDTEWLDLFHEAIKRTMTGTRKWPRKISIPVFLDGTMRSLANEYWRQHYRRKNAGVVLDCDCINPVTGEDGILESVPDEDLSEEADQAAMACLHALEHAFADDDSALAVLMAKEEGYSPSDIQKEFALSKTEYETILKRIRRKINKLKTEGPYNAAT